MGGPGRGGPEVRDKGHAATEAATRLCCSGGRPFSPHAPSDVGVAAGPTSQAGELRPRPQPRAVRAEGQLRRVRLRASALLPSCPRTEPCCPPLEARHMEAAGHPPRAPGSLPRAWPRPASASSPGAQAQAQQPVTLHTATLEDTRQLAAVPLHAPNPGLETARQRSWDRQLQRVDCREPRAGHVSGSGTRVLSNGTGSCVIVRSRRPRGYEDLIRHSGMTQSGAVHPLHGVHAMVLSKQQTLSGLT